MRFVSGCCGGVIGVFCLLLSGCSGLGATLGAAFDGPVTVSGSAGELSGVTPGATLTLTLCGGTQSKCIYLGFISQPVDSLLTEGVVRFLEPGGFRDIPLREVDSYSFEQSSHSGFWLGFWIGAAIDCAYWVLVFATADWR